MKVTDVKSFLVFDGYARNWTIVKVETDSGIYGLGEATLEGKEESVTAAIRELGSYLIGRDPFHIEHHWQVMYRGGFWIGGPVVLSAASGLEQALWDIVGKSLGQPIYNLLGGPCRDRIRVYTHVGGQSPEEFAERGRQLVEKGFTALKFDPIIGPHWGTVKPEVFRRAIKITEALREAVGEDVALMVHEHGNLSPSTAIALARALEPYNPFWFEEPVQPENIDAMAEVARSTKIPIASGERLYTRFGFRELFEKRAVSIAQPDPCHAGGILECRKIAAMAETYYISIAPHNPYGPVAVAVSVQLDACMPNFLIQEYASYHRGEHNDILLNPPKVEDGYISVPKEPGLGIRLNEEAIEKYPYQPRKFSGILAYEDGSLFGKP
ncbi:MAG: galactonate dehydratase [Candidatus Bathyarchaeia archaeon]